MSDGQSDGGPWHLGGKLERELERSDGLADVAGVIGKLILDEAAREPHQPRIHSVGIEEGPGHVEQTDDPLGEQRPQGALTSQLV